MRGLSPEGSASCSQPLVKTTNDQELEVFPAVYRGCKYCVTDLTVGRLEEQYIFHVDIARRTPVNAQQNV